MSTAPEFTAARPPGPLRHKLAVLWRWWTGEIARLEPGDAFPLG